MAEPYASHLQRRARADQRVARVWAAPPSPAPPRSPRRAALSTSAATPLSRVPPNLPFESLASCLQDGPARQPFHFVPKTPAGRSKVREPSPACQPVFHVQFRLVNRGRHVLTSLTRSAFLGDLMTDRM